MKAIFFIAMVAIGMISLHSYAMWPEDFDEEYENVEYEANPLYDEHNLIKIWALPEINRAKEGYAYHPDHSLHHVTEYGNYLHLRSHLYRGRLDEVNSRDRNGNTPLHIAAKTLEYNKVDLLFRAGANPDAINNHGQYPVDLVPEFDNGNCLGTVQPNYVIQLMIAAKRANRRYEIFIWENSKPNILDR